MQRFFDDEGFDFATLIALGLTYRAAADVGEVLATVERIEDGDREQWVVEWAATAERVRSRAEASAASGHPATARSAYLRASLYFDHASSMAPGTDDPDRYHDLWERHRDCWDRAVELFDPPVERVAIPYEGTSLEGYLFQPSGPATPAPTVILNNGSDGPVTAMWSQGGAAAVERGWSALTFDGPGQGAGLHRQGLFFRPDWEAVITPVVDFLVGRPEVDGERIALHGVSQAGYWAPRAAAFEHRLAAVVADPGVTDVSASWTAPLPDVMVELLDAGDKESFDAFMAAGMDEEPTAAAILEWRMAPYGTTSYFEAYRAARAMSLDEDTVARIPCPVLVTDPEDEQFWPGQSARLAGWLGDAATIMPFTAEEGASRHCEPAAQGLRDERVFDWLEDVLGS